MVRRGRGELSLKDIVGTVDDLPDDDDILNPDRLLEFNRGAIAELRGLGLPLVCSFRPPALAGDTKGWSIDSLLYLKVIDAFGNGDETLIVDFGPYFDYPACKPNYPENIPEVSDGIMIAGA